MEVSCVTHQAAVAIWQHQDAELEKMIEGEMMGTGLPSAAENQRSIKELTCCRLTGLQSMVAPTSLTVLVSRAVRRVCQMGELLKFVR